MDAPVERQSVLHVPGIRSTRSPELWLRSVPHRIWGMCGRCLPYLMIFNAIDRLDWWINGWLGKHIWTLEERAFLLSLLRLHRGGWQNWGLNLSGTWGSQLAVWVTNFSSTIAVTCGHGEDFWRLTASESGGKCLIFIEEKLEEIYLFYWIFWLVSWLLDYVEFSISLSFIFRLRNTGIVGNLWNFGILDWNLR